MSEEFGVEMNWDGTGSSIQTDYGAKSEDKPSSTPQFAP
jgi:hypothetical protein